MAGTPEWTIGANLGFRIPLGNTGELAPRVDLYDQTQTNMSGTNWLAAQRRVWPTSILPAYTLLNARLDLRNIGGSGVTASAWANNLLDAEYIASGTELANTGLGYTSGFTGGAAHLWRRTSFRFLMLRAKGAGDQAACSRNSRRIAPRSALSDVVRGSRSRTMIRVGT